MGIVAWIVFGLAVGIVARAVVPGRQAMGFVPTALLGIAGGVIGGVLAEVLWGSPATAVRSQGFVGSVMGAMVLLVVVELATAPRRRGAI